MTAFGRKLTFPIYFLFSVQLLTELQVATNEEDCVTIRQCENKLSVYLSSPEFCFRFVNSLIYFKPALKQSVL
jgi:hypothetical protein